MSIYPLKFEPIYIDKVWGGRRIESHFGKVLPEPIDRKIGESWELADLPGHESVVAEGPLAGKTLREVVEHYGSVILGDLELTPAGRFPLLIKFLDANTTLSLQVHPDQDYLNEHPEFGVPKHEAWYIIDAAPEAVIYRGIREGVTAEVFRKHLEEGCVEDDLVKIRAKPGHCYFVPAGTVHAIGAGVFLAEIQKPSDTTFRLYEWGRTGREVHVEQGLACCSFHPPDVREIEQRSHIGAAFTLVSQICNSPDFRIEKVRMVEGYGQEIPYDRPAVWVVLEGAGMISNTPAQVDVHFQSGEVLLLPAGMDDARVDFDEDTVWLEVQFPALLENILLA